MKRDSKYRFGVIWLVLSLVLFCACKEEELSSFFIDPRDGKTYHTVKIGWQVWMAENLNYVPIDSSCYTSRDMHGRLYKCDSWCYDNELSNCDKYGRLYNWVTAMEVCPIGWYLPNRSEWDYLVKVAGNNVQSRIYALLKWLT